MTIKFSFREPDPRKPGMEKYKETQGSPFKFKHGPEGFPLPYASIKPYGEKK